MTASVKTIQNKRTLKWDNQTENNISDQQLLAKLYMKARGKNIELVATLKSTFATDHWRCKLGSESEYKRKLCGHC